MPLDSREKCIKYVAGVGRSCDANYQIINGFVFAICFHVILTLLTLY